MLTATPFSTVEYEGKKTELGTLSKDSFLYQTGAPLSERRKRRSSTSISNDGKREPDGIASELPELGEALPTQDGERDRKATEASLALSEGGEER